MIIRTAPSLKAPRVGVATVGIEVNVVTLSNGWAGLGAQTHFVEYPTGDAGNETFHQVVRYRQVRGAPETAQRQRAPQLHEVKHRQR